MLLVMMALEAWGLADRIESVHIFVMLDRIDHLRPEHSMHEVRSDCGQDRAKHSTSEKDEQGHRRVGEELPEQARVFNREELPDGAAIQPSAGIHEIMCPAHQLVKVRFECAGRRRRRGQRRDRLRLVDRASRGSRSSSPDSTFRPPDSICCSSISRRLQFSLRSAIQRFEIIRGGRFQMKPVRQLYRPA